MIRSRILGCLLAAMMTGAFPAEAQLGGLTNKLKGQAVQSTGQPVAFDNVILELTPQRIGKILS